MTSSSVPLIKHVKRQVEFYLSEGNLLRDRFFSEQSKNRTDNGISIKLLLECNRLKSLRVGRDLLLQAVNESQLVSISEDGEAVIRNTPLADLAPKEKRTILVVGIPHQLSTNQTEGSLELPANESEPVTNPQWLIMDWLYDIFSQFGQVLYINVPRYHSSGLFRGFAFVEFSLSKEAKLAVNAMQRDATGEVWCVPPDQNAPADTIPEDAWRPRLAAKVSFAPTHMIARRYIWRCCSRKNKQIICAFRNLRFAGYRAPNPCDREYELITIGASNPEARATHIKETYKPLSVDRLHTFRYPMWEFWRSKFYLWLNVWLQRMRNKTEELASRTDTVVRDAGPVANQLVPEPTSAEVVQECNHPTHIQAEAEEELRLNLPSNFVPNTVLFILWPSHLVTEFTPTVHHQEIDKELPVQPTRRQLSQARLIRISLERYLLSACQLLTDISHVDPSPLVTVVDEVVRQLDIRYNAILQTSHHPIFVRMKTNQAAIQLCEFASQCKAEPVSSSSSRSETSRLASLHIYHLSGSSELAYCKAISNSLLGSQERNRRIQLKRRQRKKNNGAVLHGSSGSTEENVCNKISNGSGIVHGANKRQHVLFDE